MINEIFLSVQGESSLAGLPCIFIRLTGCGLRCSYCDTAYAFNEGITMPRTAVLARVGELAGPFLKYPCLVRLPLVELTGGEPLLQKGSLPLMKTLCDTGFNVLLETSGALDIGAVDPRVRRIMDLKCPSSGESDRNYWPNLEQLKKSDEVKFVIASRQDYQWAKEQVAAHNLAARCPVLFSWASPPPPGGQAQLKEVPQGHVLMSERELPEQMLADALPVRLQWQMHKRIWPAEQRGV